MTSPAQSLVHIRGINCNHDNEKTKEIMRVSIRLIDNVSQIQVRINIDEQENIAKLTVLKIYLNFSMWHALGLLHEIETS